MSELTALDIHKVAGQILEFLKEAEIDPMVGQAALKVAAATIEVETTTRVTLISLEKMMKGFEK